MPRQTVKMAEATTLNISTIHEILPTEIFVNILKRLDFKSITNAKGACKEWKKVIENFKLVEEASMKVRCIIVAGGGLDIGKKVQIMFGDFKNIQLPDLNDRLSGSSMALHNGEILLFGGCHEFGGYESHKNQECYKLWKGFSSNLHSFLTDNGRCYSSAVTTEKATFLFGGCGPTRKTYEYLPKASTTWQNGRIPIPGEFGIGSAIAVKSGQEILLIGGDDNDRKRILSFNVNDHLFTELSTNLNEGRFGHTCAYIPGTNKIMITGGVGQSHRALNSTEILNIEDGTITTGSPMNTKRFGHGIGVITINNEDRLVVFGGLSGTQGRARTQVHFVEIYNNFTEKWETTDIKVKSPNSGFAYLSVRLGDIIQKI